MPIIMQFGITPDLMDLYSGYILLVISTSVVDFTLSTLNVGPL